jgi:hypothetical protein
MEISELENRLKKLTEDINKETFIYDLLLAYDFPKATISRIKSGDLNLSKDSNELFLKKKLFFKKSEDQDPHDLIDELSNRDDVKNNNPRFIIVTNFNIFLSLDTKTKDTLDIPIQDITAYSDFFFPWIGKEKTFFKNENFVDIKAATKMGQLYDVIIQENQSLNESQNNRHSLNIFFARLLFCLFAEDTEIFSDGIFTNYLASHTLEDGSDLKKYLDNLFVSLNTKDNIGKAKSLENFPYVNGGLFKEQTEIPNFSRKSREIIIEAGKLDWGQINPDIFGSMVQAIADPEERSNFGMHYTSVENITKVLKPLFLDEFNEIYENSKLNEKALEKLLDRIYKVKFFDPACGSGNFLIITYKQICHLEIKIYQALLALNPNKWSISSSGIRVNQFYGITINDFDAEIAKLSLWLAEHQMNLFFKSVFGNSKPSLPLNEAGNIVCKNALQYDWNDLCLKDKFSEIYVYGNPPYRGARLQNESQKIDMTTVFSGYKGYNNLDYIACWFLKGAKYIKDSKANLAFVSTNSINQGEQVNLLWPHILNDLNLEIGFAERSFKWSNNAKSKAMVSCVIVSLRNKSSKEKYIYDKSIKASVKNINPYLVDAENYFIKNTTQSPKNISPMMFGSMPNDDGNLLLSTEERNKILEINPDLDKWIRPILGAEEFLNGKQRWCLWLIDADLSYINGVEEIRNRLNRVKLSRLKSKRKETKKLADTPHLFGEIRQPTSGYYILVPGITSEKREYIPMGYISSNIISSNRNLIVPNATLYEFGILHSKMHMAWVKSVGGRMEMRYSYSSNLVYNNFPWPNTNTEQKKSLENHVLEIIDIREKYSDKTIADLYDPEKMPSELSAAHNNLDLAVEKMYQDKPFLSDEERLKHLLKLHKDKINA